MHKSYRSALAESMSKLYKDTKDCFSGIYDLAHFWLNLSQVFPTHVPLLCGQGRRCVPCLNEHLRILLSELVEGVILRRRTQLRLCKVLKGGTNDETYRNNMTVGNRGPLMNDPIL